MNINNFPARTKESSKQVEKGQTRNYLKTFLFGGTVVNLALGFFYLMMLNSLSTRGFDLEELKAEKMNLRKQLEEVDIALAIPTSLYALESDERVQSMAVVEKKTYMEVLESGLAFVEKKVN